MNNFFYRPEIDGLRCIAVLPVIFFHAGFELFNGGFIGVDVFFVISGYLITSIILKEKQEGKFTLLNFYERRARRILPPLFIVIICCLPLAWMLMTPNDLKDFGQSLMATSTFLSNYHFFMESGYFATAGEFNPLLHTWSLALEEQFYVIYPIFILLLWKFKRTFLLIFISIIALVSLFLAQWGDNLSTTYPYFKKEIFIFNQPIWASFYLPTGRIWELMLGALIAFYLNKEKPEKFNQLLSILGLSLIFYSAFAFSSETPYPSIYTLLPTTGTALILLFATPNTIINKLLSQKPIVFIGLISYSAYLYHQPLFAFARLGSLNKPSLRLMLLLCMAAFILAYFSWRFIEKPFRNKNVITKNSLWICVLVAYLPIFSIGLVTHLNKGFEFRWDEVKARYPAINLDNEYLLQQKLSYEKSIGQKEFSSNLKKSTKILIIGNSHAYDLHNAFRLNQELTPHLEFRINTFGIANLLNRSKESESVVNRFIETDLFKSADILLVSTQYQSDDDINSLYGLNLLAKKHNKSLVIAGNIPEFRTRSADPLSDIIFLPKIGFSIAGRNRALNKNEIERSMFNLLINDIYDKNKKIRKITNELNLIYLDKFEFTCNHNNKTCKAITNKGNKIYSDQSHYTLKGAKYIGEIIYNIKWLKPLENMNR